MRFAVCFFLSARPVALGLSFCLASLLFILLHEKKLSLLAGPPVKPVARAGATHATEEISINAGAKRRDLSLGQGQGRLITPAMMVWCCLHVRPVRSVQRFPFPVRTCCAVLRGFL